MKNRILFSALLLAALTSCKKNNSKEDDSKDPFKLEYSNLPVEQHKNTLETNGVDFIKKINTLPDEDFIPAIEHLAELDLELLSNNVVGKQIIASTLSAKKQNISALFNAVAEVNPTPNGRSLKEYYGIYTWDSSQNDWVKTASDSKLEINYPATSVSKTNNATLTVTYTASSVKAELNGERFELPASANASLKVAGKELLKLVSAYEYKADGTPTKSDVTVAMGSFTFKTDVTNDLSTVIANVSMTKGTEVLFSVNVSGKGNGNYTDIVDSDNIEEIIKNANTTFEIMDIKIVGEIDVNAMALAEKSTLNLPEKESTEAMAAAFNKHSKLVAIYKSENAIVAKAEYASVENKYSYEIYNPNTGKTETVTSSNWIVEPRLVFKDGSKVSLETYFNSGFSKLIDDVEDYINRF